MASPSFDIKFNKSNDVFLQFAAEKPSMGLEVISPETLKKIHKSSRDSLSSDPYVSVPQKEFTAKVEEFLKPQGENTPELQKIHKLVLAVLTHTSEESEISKILKTVKNLESFINATKEIDPVNLSEGDKKVLLHLREQLVNVGKSIDSIIVPKEITPQKQELELLKAQLYEQVNKMWMKVIKLIPQTTIPKDAADEGTAYTATVSAAVAVQEQGILVTPSGQGSQEVYLRPKEKGVFKVSDEKSAEDELIAQQLSYFMATGEGYLPSFEFGELNPQKLGHNYDVENRGFNSNHKALQSDAFLKNLTSFTVGSRARSVLTTLLANEKNYREYKATSFDYVENGVTKKISFNELFHLIDTGSIDDPKNQAVAGLYKTLKTNKAFEDARRFDKPEQRYLWDKTNYERQAAMAGSSFEGLQKLFKSKEGFRAKLKILDSNGVSREVSFEEYCRTHEDFLKALVFDPNPLEAPKSSPRFSFIPYFPDITKQKSYEACEKTQWHYLDGANWKTVTFKELQILWLEDKITNKTFVCQGGQGAGKSIDKFTKEELEKGSWEYYQIKAGEKIGKWVFVDPKTLDSLPKETLIRTRGDAKRIPEISTPTNLRHIIVTPWKLITPQVYSDSSMSSIKEAKGKPFVDMTSIRTLHKKNPAFLDFFINRISTKSEGALLLTARQQFLDLHAENIGVATELTVAEYDTLIKTYKNNTVLNEVINRHTAVLKDLAKYEYFYNGKNHSFEECRSDYKSGVINQDTILTQSVPQTISPETLKATLQDCLKGKKNPFDTLSTLKFTYQDKTNVNFTQLFEDYKNKTITDLSGVTAARIITSAIKKNAALKEGLDLDPLLEKACKPAELVFFDTDLLLSESNELTVYDDKLFLPIRSGILSVGLKDKPLEKETIDGFLNGTKARREKMVNWIDSKDAPIRQFLSPNPEFLEKCLQAKLEQEAYSLSTWRSKRSTSIGGLRKMFSKDISKLADNKALWDKLQTEIQSYTLHQRDILAPDGRTPRAPNEMWEALAKKYLRHNEKLEEKIKVLKELNPLIIDTTVLTTQIKLNVPSPYSSPLNVDTPASLELRKRIANDLFPKLTLNQKKALLEREEKLEKYLNAYKKIDKPFPTIAPKLYKLDENLKTLTSVVDELENFMKISPLTTLERNNYSNQLTRLKDLLVDLGSKAGEKTLGKDFLEVKQKIQKIDGQIKKSCIPTYANTLHVMYPLSADAEFLYRAKQPDLYEAGFLITNYRYSLRDLIGDIKLSYSPLSSKYKTADILERKLNDPNTTRVYPI